MSLENYRPVSTTAVCAVVFALVSLVGLLVPFMTVLAALGLFCAILSLLQIRKYQLAGQRLALTSLFVSLGAMVLIPYWHHFVYASEALSGYQREDFGRLNKSDRLQSLQGKPICLKGYRILDSSSRESDRLYSFSSDGDSNDAESVVLVELNPGEPGKPDFDAIAISGTLELSADWTEGSTAPRFVLRNAVVRKSRTIFDLNPYYRKC